MTGVHTISRYRHDIIFRKWRDLSGAGGSGTINVYDSRLTQLANDIHDALKSIFTIKDIAQRTMRGVDNFRGEFWKVSGLDIEVVL